MKTSGIILIAICFVLCGCDYVDVPTQTGGPIIGNTNGIVRRVLIEEFTGHLCTACPSAAEKLDTIQNLYPDQVIAIAIHTGWFADPCPPSPLPAGAIIGQFTENFTTGSTSGEGVEYDQTFPGLASQPPAGLVNRLGFPSGTYRIEKTFWISVVDSLLRTPAVADLQFDTVVYNSTTRQVDFIINGEFINAQNSSFNIAVMLVEDSLTGWQLDGGILVPNYTFHHVLRSCVNTPGSIVGNQIAAGSIAAGTSFLYDLPSAYTVNSSWHAEHCKLVAFIYNTTTKEVLQAAEAELVH